jgi:heme A synthase
MTIEVYISATIQIITAILSLFLFLFALHTHNENKEQKEISNIVRIGLVVFALLELTSFSNTFGILPNIGLTHLFATVLMILLALALKIQLDIKEELGGE